MSFGDFIGEVNFILNASKRWKTPIIDRPALMDYALSLWVLGAPSPEWAAEKVDEKLKELIR